MMRLPRPPVRRKKAHITRGVRYRFLCAPTPVSLVAGAESICKHPCPVRTGSMFGFSPAPVGSGGSVSRCEAASRFLWPPPYPAIYYRSLPEDVISLNCDKYAIRLGVCRETERNRFCGKTAEFSLFLEPESSNSLVPGGFLPGDDPSPTSGRKSVFPSTCQLQILHNRPPIPVFPLSGDDPSPACC